MSASNKGAHLPPIPPSISGCFYNLLMAMTEALTSQNKQQISDANMTANAGTFETNLNTWYYGASGPIQALINKMKQDANNPNALPIDQANFNTANAMAQAATGAAESWMQQANAQVNTDASDIQALIGLAKSLDTVGFVANLLAH